MAVALDAIRAVHNAFRQDMAAIDEAANIAAKGGGNLDIVQKRYNFFNEVLVWHATGEEEYVFPAVERVAPLVSEPYERDHRGLDSLFDSLQKAISTSDKLEVARTTCAFKFHLNIHLNKEEAHLYRIFNERIPLPEQGSTIGKMSQIIPQERFPELIGWLIPLIRLVDRENMTRIWQQALPDPAFKTVAKLIEEAAGDDWADLIRRIPELKSIADE